MAGCLFGTKKVPEPMIIMCQFDHLEETSQYKTFFREDAVEMFLPKWQPFCWGLKVLTHWPLWDLNVILKM